LHSNIVVSTTTPEVSLDTISDATVSTEAESQKCQRIGCTVCFAPRGNKLFCDDSCRKKADRESPAFKRRQAILGLRRQQRKQEHINRQRRDMHFDFDPRYSGHLRRDVPRAMPPQLPPLTAAQSTQEQIQRKMLEQAAKRAAKAANQFPAPDFS
jgi:hypothetical protein